MVHADTGLAAVRTPILFIADAAHPVCSPGCGTRLARIVGSTDVTSEWTQGDPQRPACGALMARRSWPRVADWLLARDGPS